MALFELSFALHAGVTILNCEYAVITIATKVAHVLVNGAKNCKIRLNKGVVTTVELVHCENVSFVQIF